MSMHMGQSGYSNQEHQLRQANPTATTSLSISVIIVIGVCGGLGLLLILLLILFFVKRGQHGKGKRKESLGELDEAAEIRRAIRSTRPPDLDLGRRRSYLQFFGNKKTSLSNPWVDEDGLHGPQSSNTKAFAPGGGSGISHHGWPLVPLKTPPAAPEGPSSPSDFYPVISPSGNIAVPPQSYLKRQSYNSAPGDGNLDLAGIPRSTIRHVPFEPQKLTTKRRSVSDNHLTSILRSTSQRMRDRRASQRPLSRAHSALSQISGAPPSQRLPSPPRNNFGENSYGDSREGLIDSREKCRPFSEHSYDTSNYESILDNFPTRRTPSPSKSVPWSADHVTGKRSPTPSAASDEDSLCSGKTPDFTVPFHLTSPSRRQHRKTRPVNGDERQSVHIYSEEEDNTKCAIDTSTRIRKESRASIQAFGYFDLPGQQRRSLAKSRDPDSGNDPFYSGVVKSGRLTPRVNQILIGPRSPPRKSNTPNRGHCRNASIMPRSFLSQCPASASDSKLPLGDISGNSTQSSPNKSHDQPGRDLKLDVQLPSLQWSPEPTRKKSVPSMSSRVARQHHQGHKRQNVVRMSGLPRPRSVCPVPEESEDLNGDDVFSTWGLDLSKVPSVPPPLIRLPSTESLTRTASWASLYSRYSMMDNVQPPSSSVFEPRLTLLPLGGKAIRESVSMTSTRSSPTLGPHYPNLNPSSQTGDECAYLNPSIGAYDHHGFALTEKTQEAVDDFPGSPSKTKRFSKGKTRRMGRNFSIDCGTVTAKGSMLAFPTPPIPAVSSHTMSDPFSNASTSLLPFSMPSPATTPASYSQPAPPLLTRSHSPHSPPRLPDSSDFLLKNITQLRRGNSTLSNYSINSMGSTLTIGLGEKDDGSPTLANLRGGGISPSKYGSEYENGNRNYLNLSNPNSTRSSPTKQASSTFLHTTTQAFQNSPTLGERNFPLAYRSNAPSPFKTLTFEELSKGPTLGLGIGVSTSNSQQTCTENEGRVFETSEPDTPSKKPSRKFKSIRKRAKSRRQQDNVDTAFGLTSSPPCLSTMTSEREALTEVSKPRSFEFENYSPLHFENLEGFRFTTASYDDDDDDGQGYSEDGEDVIEGEESGVGDVTDSRGETKAASTEKWFEFRRIQNFAAEKHESSKSPAASLNIAIPGLNLSQQKPTVAKDDRGTGWEPYSQSKPIPPSPSMGMATTSPTQLSHTQPGFSNSSASQSTTQMRSAPITQANKSTEILSPIPTPTSSSHSQIMKDEHQEEGILQLNYAKTSHWLWEETTPKLSPFPSPDRQIGNVPAKGYKAHSRNESHNQNSSNYGDNRIERRMGNPLSSNPTVSSLTMAEELGMEEPRIIDLDEANNFTPTHPTISNIENLDPKTVHVREKAEMEERDITEAATTGNINLNLNANLSAPTSPPTPPTSNSPAITPKDIAKTSHHPLSQVHNNPTILNESPSQKIDDEAGKGKKSANAKGKNKTKTNFFSRHHKGHQQRQLQDVEEEVEVRSKRRSLYDQEGFLKSSPAAAAGSERGKGRGGRRWR